MENMLLVTKLKATDYSEVLHKYSFQELVIFKICLFFEKQQDGGTHRQIQTKRIIYRKIHVPKAHNDQSWARLALVGGNS